MTHIPKDLLNMSEEELRGFCKVQKDRIKQMVAREKACQENDRSYKDKSIKDEMDLYRKMVLAVSSLVRVGDSGGNLEKFQISEKAAAVIQDLVVREEIIPLAKLEAVTQSGGDVP